jgi:hypothetical protein
MAADFVGGLSEVHRQQSRQIGIAVSAATMRGPFPQTAAAAHVEHDVLQSDDAMTMAQSIIALNLACSIAAEMCWFKLP